MKRVEGYMTRAEQLRTMLSKNDVAKTVTAGGTVELEKYASCAPYQLMLVVWHCVLTPVCLWQGGQKRRRRK